MKFSYGILLPEGENLWDMLAKVNLQLEPPPDDGFYQALALTLSGDEVYMMSLDEQEQDNLDPEPTEPTEEEYSAEPEEQGGSQETSGDAGSNLEPGSKRGEPDTEPSGLDVPGAWRGVDEESSEDEDSEEK